MKNHRVSPQTYIRRAFILTCSRILLLLGNAEHQRNRTHREQSVGRGLQSTVSKQPQHSPLDYLCRIPCRIIVIPSGSTKTYANNLFEIVGVLKINRERDHRVHARFVQCACNPVRFLPKWHDLCFRWSATTETSNIFDGLHLVLSSLWGCLMSNNIISVGSYEGGSKTSWRN